MSHQSNVPGIRGHLLNALDAINSAQSQCQAAATLLGFNAGFGAADAEEKRDKAARLEQLQGQLEKIAETIQDMSYV